MILSSVSIDAVAGHPVHHHDPLLREQQIGTHITAAQSQPLRRHLFQKVHRLLNCKGLCLLFRPFQQNRRDRTGLCLPSDLQGKDSVPFCTLCSYRHLPPLRLKVRLLLWGVSAAQNGAVIIVLQHLHIFCRDLVSGLEPRVFIGRLSLGLICVLVPAGLCILLHRTGHFAAQGHQLGQRGQCI